METHNRPGVILIKIPRPERCDCGHKAYQHPRPKLTLSQLLSRRRPRRRQPCIAVYRTVRGFGERCRCEDWNPNG